MLGLVMSGLRVAADGLGHPIRPVDPRRSRGRPGGTAPPWPRDARPAHGDYEPAVPRAGHPGGAVVRAGNGAGARSNQEKATVSDLLHARLANAVEMWQVFRNLVENADAVLRRYFGGADRGCVNLAALRRCFVTTTSTAPQRLARNRQLCHRRCGTSRPDHSVASR